MKISGIVLILVLFIPINSFGMEQYYINKERVLLYKLINWWYSCEEQCEFLCGKDIELYLIGRNSLELNRKNITLTMDFPEHQIDLPDKTYFSNDKKNSVTLKKRKYIFKFYSSSKNRFKKFKKNLSNIGIKVAGKISGVINSKISLNGEKTDKGCGSEKEKIVFSIINFKPKENISSFELN